MCPLEKKMQLLFGVHYAYSNVIAGAFHFGSIKFCWFTYRLYFYYFSNTCWKCSNSPHKDSYLKQWSYPFCRCHYLLINHLLPEKSWWRNERVATRVTEQELFGYTKTWKYHKQHPWKDQHPTLCTTGWAEAPELYMLQMSSHEHHHHCQPRPGFADETFSSLWGALCD